jgi:hypothetical protein
MTEIVINNISADIYKDIPISLNFSIADIRNPEKRNTSFSKTITLPGTKANNTLFSYIFEISKESDSTDALNFSPDFNPAIKALCKVYTNTLLQIDGYCQLLKVIKTNNYYEYEICIFGVIGDFFTSIDNKLLTDIDFSEYNHELIQDNVESSWNDFIIKNGLKYVNFNNTYSKNYSALIHSAEKFKILTSDSPILADGAEVNINGYIYIILSSGTSGLYTIFETTEGIYDVTIGDSITVKSEILTSEPIGEGYVYPCINYGYGTSMYQYDALTMYPSIYVKSYLDKIFKLSGFTYSGLFKDSDILKHLIIPASSNVDRVNASTTTINTAIQDYTTDTEVISTTVLGGQRATLLFPNTVQDASDLFDVTTGYFRANKTGAYEIIVDYDISATGDTIGGVYYGATVYLNVETTNTLGGTWNSFVSNHVVTYNTDGTFTGQFRIPSKALNQGNLIRVYVLAVASVTVNIGTELTIKPISIPLAIGDVFNLSSVVPKNITNKDFFLSIVKMFNLYIRQDEQDNRNLIIESASDFYNSNSVVDWTNKLDRGSQIEILPVSEVEGKNYVFAYKEDGDYYNTLYKDTYKEVYGNRDVQVLNDFVKGKKEISVSFSPTVSVDTSLNKMVVPHIVTREDDGTFSPFDSNIRILYYGGLKPCLGSFTIMYSSNVTYTSYPYCGHVDEPLSPTLDLLFEIPKVIYWNTSIYTTGNLYNTYYRKFIDEITDKNSKLIRGKFRLRDSDICNLNFKNFIQVDNINYRLNKILDYSPIEPNVCIVELSKIKNGIDYTAYQIDLDPTIFNNLIQGGLDEVRSLSATSYIQLIQGGVDEVQGLFSDSPIQIINGGTD